MSVTPRDILGWRSEVKDGKQQLTQLRLMETITVPDASTARSRCSRYGC